MGGVQGAKCGAQTFLVHQIQFPHDHTIWTLELGTEASLSPTLKALPSATAHTLRAWDFYAQLVPATVPLPLFRISSGILSPSQPCKILSILQASITHCYIHLISIIFSLKIFYCEILQRIFFTLLQSISLPKKYICYTWFIAL